MSTPTVALPPAFYDRDAVLVAKDLLGCTLSRGEVVLRVTETEAYRQDDTACHASRGRTARNAPLFGPPGLAYVYLCYGIHHLLNVSVDREGWAAGVLFRAATVVAGAEVVRARRGGRLDLVGPGKVGQALAVDTAHSGLPVEMVLDARRGTVEPDEAVVAGPRVGIGYATPADQALPWRFRLVPA